MNNDQEQRKGFLSEKFRIFHVESLETDNVDMHYHDFYKILIFLSGQVTYMIEGKFYPLSHGDVLLISQNDLHRVIMDSSKPYRRIIIWISKEFIEKNSTKDASLFSCFEAAQQQGHHLLRLDPDTLHQIQESLLHIQSSESGSEFAGNLMAELQFLEFLIRINRASLSMDRSLQLPAGTYHSKIEEITSYINEHLEEDLSIDHLADRFFISKYYLMHWFKSETGFTLYNYILQKRLMKAAAKLKRGESITTAYLSSGFKDYSSFLRAFKKLFQVSPGHYRKNQSR